MSNAHLSCYNCGERWDHKPAVLIAKVTGYRCSHCNTIWIGVPENRQVDIGAIASILGSDLSQVEARLEARRPAEETS